MRRAWLALQWRLLPCRQRLRCRPRRREFPYCIKGCDFGAGTGDCSFSSLAQCQATASGRDAYCAANPYFNAKAEMQTDRSRQSRRRF